MSSISTYSAPDYCMSFGNDDVVFVDLVIEISKDVNHYSLKIVKAQINAKKMEFALFILPFLTDTGALEVNKKIEELLIGELTPRLFSLYYAGELSPHA